jgi:hypothetical protein
MEYLFSVIYQIVPISAWVLNSCPYPSLTCLAGALTSLLLLLSSLADRIPMSEGVPLTGSPRLLDCIPAVARILVS